MYSVSIMRHSLYWDDFNKRIEETSDYLNGKSNVLPVRRVAVFVTDKCNFKCRYCNVKDTGETMEKSTFLTILEKYGKEAIIHLTGGEPSMVPWLFPTIMELGDKYRFHLNTNGYRTPPYKCVKRLKISLDSCDPVYWNALVGRKNAFEVVVDNIKESIPHTVVSITFTLSKNNYKQAIDFARFARNEFTGLYALFFSVYKGCQPDFEISKEDANDIFDNVLPELSRELSEESLALLRETIDEKRRLIQGIRFEQDLNKACYISMSERVFSPDGTESCCSHLYRDGIMSQISAKHEKCKYGCNQRLVQFNREVENRINK